MPRIIGSNGSNATGQTPAHLQQEYRNPRAGRKTHHLRNTLVVIILLFLVLMALCACLGYKLYQDGMQIQAHENKAMEFVSDIKEQTLFDDPDSMNRNVPKMQEETAAARQIAHGTLWNATSKLPLVGEDVRNFQEVVDVIDDFSHQSLPLLSDATHQLLTASYNQVDGRFNLQPITQAGESFTKISDGMNAQAERLKTLPKSRIRKLDKISKSASDHFSSMADLANSMNSAVHFLPQLMGSQGPRTYIIVAQTPSETRSSGGLIGSLGSMTADNGKVVVNDFHPNSEFIPLGAGSPEDARQIFSSPLSFSFDIRDLTAYPDFSQSAQAINARWQQSPYAGKVDGVLMIDPVFIQEVIKISGDIQLSNGLTLTGDNTAQFFLNDIYKSFPISQQDEVLSSVARQAMNNVFTKLDTRKLIALSKIIKPLAQQRHLYAYTFHAEEAANFQGAGLAKDAPNNEEDPEVGIYLNQNNPSKLDWYLHRSTEITRTSCATSGKQTYHVRFRMTNNIPKNDLASGNWYILGGNEPFDSPGTSLEKMLIYPPAGGSISNLKSDGGASAMQQTTLNGKKLYMGTASVAPGKSVVYEFDVNTSDKATADLTLDQTPMGWSDTGITYGPPSCNAQR